VRVYVVGNVDIMCYNSCGRSMRLVQGEWVDADAVESLSRYAELEFG
jgi:hypothetical protein